MQINLVLREKNLTLAENSPTYWIVSDNDDYVLHIDLDEQRQAMFAAFVNNGQAIKCTIDSEGFVLDKNGNRSVPMWALANPVMTVGVVSDGYASHWVEIPIVWSVKRLYEEEIAQPDDPLVEQLIRLTNDMIAPSIEVDTNVGTTYKLRITDKNGTFITPNLRGDIGASLSFSDLTAEEKASLKGDKGDPGDRGATGAPFTYDMFTEAQLASLRGQQGIQGERGEPFQIKKTYASISAMNADFNNAELNEGDFVMIASNVEDEDNAKVYVKGSSAFVLVVDLSGAQGIKGDAGDRGIQGERGLQGTGVASATVTNGNLILTLTDNTTINAGNVKGNTGDKGSTGDPGVSVVDAGINSSGHLILAFSDNTTVDAGYAKGEAGSSGADGSDGSDGADGVSIESAEIDENGNLILTLTDETTIDVGHVVGADGIQGEDGQTGADGVGISSASVNASGELVLTLTNGNTVNAGNVVGATGARGVGVTGASVDANYHLILTLSNSTTVDAGYVRGAQGETGATGNGISNTTYSNGKLTIHYTDGTSSNEFDVKGGVGDTGATGNGIASATFSNGYLTLHYTDGTDSNAFYVKGDTGNDGGTGQTGADGKSAFAVAQENGFTGTVEQWLASLKGDKGDAFEYSDFTSAQLEALKGETGDTGNGIASASVSNGYLTLTYTDNTTSSPMYVKGDAGASGADGSDGSDGKSAFEIAQDNGFSGNESAWLASLVGQTGSTGVGISSASIDANYHLILTKTDGNTVDAGYARGATGSAGQDYVLTNQDKSDIATLVYNTLQSAESGSY